MADTIHSYVVIRRDDGKYLTGQMVDGGAAVRWTDNPNLAYTFESAKADAIAERLRDRGDDVTLIRLG